MHAFSAYLCVMRGLFLLCFIGAYSLVLGQNIPSIQPKKNVEKLTLNRCIELALSQNLDIQLSSISTQNADNEYSQSKFNLSPEISGNAGQYYQSGRSIDRFTNQFVQTTIGSNNFQLQGNWVLFAGGQLRNAVNQAKYNKFATEQDLIQTKQTVALNVALAYLQCLQAKEQEKVSQNTVNSNLLEVDRITKLLNSGMANEGMLWSAKAQYLNGVSLLTQATNAYKACVNGLKNLLMIQPEVEIELMEVGNIGVEKKLYPISLGELIDSAFAKRPEIKAAQYRVEAAQFSVKAAKGSLYPTLSIGGNLNTVYSDNAKTITGMSLIGSQTIGVVKNSLELVEAPLFAYNTQTIDFGKQVKDNFGQSFGATLSLPIYGKLQVHNQIKKAELGLLQNIISLKKNIQLVRNDVNTAYINYENSLSKFIALEETWNAQKKNLDFVKIRFSGGQATQFELQSAENANLSAYQNLISAKYELVFRKIFLDFIYRNTFIPQNIQE